MHLELLKHKYTCEYIGPGSYKGRGTFRGSTGKDQLLEGDVSIGYKTEDNSI